MHLSPSTLLLVGIGLCLTGISPAQQQDPMQTRSTAATAFDPEKPDPGLFMGQAGLHYLDGELVAIGDHFRARFDEAGPEYTPALPTAPRIYPTSFRVTGYGRGAANLAPSAGKLSMEELTAYYHRAEFVEAVVTLSCVCRCGPI